MQRALSPIEILRDIAVHGTTSELLARFGLPAAMPQASSGHPAKSRENNPSRHDECRHARVSPRKRVLRPDCFSLHDSLTKSMSLLSTFPLFPTVPWLAEKRSGRPGYLYRQSGIIRFSVFPATTIQPQLFDAKSLPISFISNVEAVVRNQHQETIHHTASVFWFPDSAVFSKSRSCLGNSRAQIRDCTV